ncbi:LURP-one-related 12-like protein [Drosera capensis]
MSPRAESGSPVNHLEEDGSAHLTVFKTSLFFSGDGFAVFDPAGHLVFRVDSYGGPDTHDKDELVLMDAVGHAVLTVRRKRPSLHQRWEGYLGERHDDSKPIFSVKRSSIIGHSGLTVEMYNNPGEEYHIDGSFHQRSCTVYEVNVDHSNHRSNHDEKVVVAEIKRKVDPDAHVLLGKDVFMLCVKQGFDPAFAMALVLVLDQISGNGDGLFDYLASAEVHPADEDYEEHEKS